jgi:lipopolysaccharide cholinephosphotransferase
VNDLQGVELELLRQFTGVCEQLGLTYYMACGSALGAVKYGGFIPWDDDIDVAMPRADYERFIEQAGTRLPEYLFLQNYHTDPKAPFFYTKLRDSRTTYIENSTKHLPMNHGIFLDIFQLDGYPADEKAAKKLERKKAFYQLQISCVYSSKRSWKSAMVCAVGRLLGWHRRTQKILGKLDKLISRYPLEGSRLWCNHGNWQGRLEYAPKEQYGAGAWVDFEGLRVRIPENSDAYLTQKYGDWRADLQEDQKVGHHYYTVCDTQRSYSEYM